MSFARFTPLPGPRVASRLALTAALFATTLGCQSLRIIDEDPASSGSRVEYLPRSSGVAASPSTSRATHPAPPASYSAPSRAVAWDNRGGSSVRYEPIQRRDAITGEQLWGDNEDHDRLEAAPAARSSTGSRTAPRGSSPPAPSTALDLPLEDRADAKRPTRAARETEVDRSIYGPRFTADGIAFPYPTDKFFRGFGACRGRRHHHEGIDLGGVGPQWGIGTPIRSMARAEILFIGTGETDPDQFGAPDKRPGEALRGDRMLPRSKVIEPYGTVYFFTRTKGRWRSGTIVVTRALEGPLAGHTIRYLHLAAVHPELGVGSILEAGQELGLMGGTGVQESAPHLHLDIAAPDGRRLDVAPILGLNPTASCKDEPPQMLASRPAPATPSASSSSRATPRDTADSRPSAPVGAVATVAAAPAVPRSPSRAHDPYAHIPDAAAATPRPASRPPTNEAAPRSAPAAAVHEAGPIQLSRCRSVTRREDFASGRYAAHAVDLDLGRKAALTIEVTKKAGAWRPKLEVVGGSGKALATGKLGKKAVHKVEVEGPVKVRVTGWDGQPPQDASYALEIKETCRRR